jgi:ribosome biogenesis SPOUT family RNA methylase Rps3
MVVELMTSEFSHENEWKLKLGGLNFQVMVDRLCLKTSRVIILEDKAYQMLKPII